MREFGDSYSNVSLIDGLTESLQPVQRRNVSREIILLVGILAVQFVGTMALISENTMAVFTHNPGGLTAKAVLLGSLALGFTVLAFRSFDPTAPRYKNLALVVGGLLAGFALLTLDRHFGGSANSILMPNRGMMCLVSSISFSLPMFIGLTVFMRGAAPTKPKMTALYIGLASGGWGTFIYGLQCPFTNLPYVILWYGGAVALTTLAAAVLLPRLARW